MDGLAYLIMQIFTVLLVVGTVGGFIFVGKTWRKRGKEY
ncbi:hypothetical protein SAMN04488123_10375 [Natribacillus halophilus]|uniref:Uncharacterized protein n=1 Tax=Natribacillus halophilus TaxID=549003 RepID=A0A1G8LGA5_9BACI|nr:hypothetical protein SAMN04488123_10375 [Natribacillus halophilus]